MPSRTEPGESECLITVGPKSTKTLTVRNGAMWRYAGTMTVEPLPDWVIPPAGGFSVEDFLQLHSVPKHTELIDGSLTRSDAMSRPRTTSLRI
jgi:hypothetical protein